MFRAEGGSGRPRGALLAAALMLAAAGLPSPSPALPSEPSANPDAASPARAEGAESEDAERLAGDVAGDYGSEQRAQELYLDGMEKIDGGHPEWARATFEALIARYPETSAAGLARRRLGELHREAAAERPAGSNTALAAPQPAPAPAAAAQVSTWEQELRRNSPIQTKLREAAGDRVFFSAGSAELGSRARSALAAQAQWLNRWREFEAAVEGHADEAGTDEQNLQLSRARAEAVRQRLVEEGVAASRLAIVARGRSQRLATCKEPDCSAQNRRVVTLVFAAGTSVRLGLGPGANAESASAPAAPAAARTVQVPAASEPSGVTR